MNLQDTPSQLDMVNSDLVNKLPPVRVLVIGDAMLDRYVYGHVERISPEAPVPVFVPRETKTMLGGAGNVAANLQSLGCSVHLLTRVGSKAERQTLSVICDSGIVVHPLVQSGFKMPTKTRIIAGNNHLMRIDDEMFVPLAPSGSSRLVRELSRLLANVDVLLISDYGKGFLVSSACHAAIEAAREAGCPVVVDPKGADYTKYAWATLVKPNLKELALATRRTFDSHAPNFWADVESSARELVAAHHFGGLLVTLSENGMLYVPADSAEAAIHLPTEAQEVFDVSGAGDTSLAVLGAALGAGIDIFESMRLANAAAGVVVSKLGTATVTCEELRLALEPSGHRPPNRKIRSIEEVYDLCEPFRKKNLRIGFTNGCFDCCHLGHLRSLQEARSLCDVLVVGLNSDHWIRTHKGANRPIQDERTRAELLASLEYVDFVVLFGHETALPLVRKLRPDVIAKEGYPLEKWPEGRFVAAYGGRAVVLDRVEGYSTTALARKMKA